MNRLYYGSAFYPELWDKNVIAEDIVTMKKIGINVVRMGEFAWSKMEPQQDSINLDFFIDVIEQLCSNGISTVFCTPTAAPPIWISHGHPERMFVDAKGLVMSHGARQHCCMNNDYFRKRSATIVEEIAKAIGQLPGLLAWQIDNEFKCHVAECFCANCKGQWHKWLEQRYGSVEKLNDLWGTGVWSQGYRYFEQIPQPLPAPFVHNPSLLTTYQIFTREKTAEFNDDQVNIIRKYSDKPITHNTNRAHRIDNELIFANLDFASFDNYPNCDDYKEMLLDYDLWRNMKKNVPFWVMETSTSHNGYTEKYEKSHRNGFLVAEAVSACAFGANGFLYWLWRQQRSGCELVHGAVISCWGQPTIGYNDVVKAKQVLDSLEPILVKSKPVQSQLAITYSDISRVFFLTEPLEKLDYLKLISDWYQRVLNMGIHRDLIFERNSLEGYKILMTPFMPYLSEQYLHKASTFVKQGGIWIVGPLTAGRTAEHTVHTDSALGRLESIAGIKAIFTYPMTNTDCKGTAFGITAPLGLWSSVYEPVEANVLGITEEGVTPGKPFLTECVLGKGKIVMLGSMPCGQKGDLLLKAMIERYAQETELEIRFDVSVGTVVAPRWSKEGVIWIIVNMDGRGGNVLLPGRGIDVLSGQNVSGKLDISEYEYRAIMFED